jgi:lysyl-tRNA synthetase class 2
MIETQAFLVELAAGFRGESGYDQEIINLLVKPAWQRMTVKEAFVRHAPLSMAKALSDDCFDEILVEYVEPHLGRDRPCFLHDYPTVLGSLAKTSSINPEVAERFELYIRGVELANGFSELTDPVEQQRRFDKEADLARAQGALFGDYPEKFLADLARIETACGIALGVDRLVMLLTGAQAIDEVVSFSPETL